MERFLREWAREAASKSQYETAIFVADKVLALTGNDQDAVKLAQLHFTNGSYSRALSLLAHHDLTKKNPECRYLAAHCHIKQGQTDEALAVLGEKTPGHLLQASSNTRPKLARGDIHARSTSSTTTAIANATSRHGKATSRSGRDRSDSPVKDAMALGRDNEDNANRGFEAGMAHLRGICYAKQNAFDRAKECYMDAVRIDVQHFEAFDQLMKNSLMSPAEEWTFLESLNFDSVAVPTADPSTAQQAAELTRMLYTTRLSKYKNPSEFNNALETLCTHYNLSQNADLLLSRAELLFTQCRFKDALALTTAILDQDPDNLNPIPMHTACLHELADRNSLQLLAHALTDRHPLSPSTWLTVGVYYLSIGAIATARRHFSKSSMQDPHFGPAWIGFAHTFAAEGEHDQAISAYSTAARLFQGSHLPHLFLGMQCLQNGNLRLAAEFLQVAMATCPDDPLLLNEVGVCCYEQEDLDHAILYLTRALRSAEACGADPRSVIATRINLGHAHRRHATVLTLQLHAGANTNTNASADSTPASSSKPPSPQKQHEHKAARDASTHHTLALRNFDEALRQGGRDAGVFAAKGMVLLEMGRAREAVGALHEALGVNPLDAVAGELLGRALEEVGGARGDVAHVDGGSRVAGGEDEDAILVGDHGGVYGAPPRANGSFGLDADAEEVERWIRGRKREVLDGNGGRAPGRRSIGKGKGKEKLGGDDAMDVEVL